MKEYHTDKDNIALANHLWVLKDDQNHCYEDPCNIAVEKHLLLLVAIANLTMCITCVSIQRIISYTAAALQ